MALSYARPDPSSPSAVASASFTTARKGFDQVEVREFLQQVAAELTRLHEREHALQREIDALRAAPRPTLELDEATVTAMLGEETGRVLATAREAAGQIRAKAEEGSARLLSQTQEDAARLREQSELEAARKRQDAVQDAEAELERAREQGRQMVEEAREYREKVLADLAKRREVGRQQLEQLAGGRDRLLQAFEQARVVAVEVQGELRDLGSDPDDFVNLAPTTGPVPVTRAARPAPAAAPSVAGRVTLAVAPEPAVAEPEAVVEPEPDVEPAVEPEPTPDEKGSDVVPSIDAPADGSPAEADRPEAGPAPVVALFAGELSDTPAMTSHVADEAPKPSVDDLFARLRAAKVDEIARDALADTGQIPVVGSDPETSGPGAAPTSPAAPTSGDAAEPARFVASVAVADDPGYAAAVSEAADAYVPDAEHDSPFVQRDDALAPIELNLSRRFKRALADEQNDVLDVLRRRDPVRSLEAILPNPDDHLKPYTDAARDELPSAARVGAASMSTDDPGRLDRRIADANVMDRTVEVVGPEIIDPLRERILHAVSNAGGDNGVIAAAVRSIYREWKTERLDDLAASLTRSAYARGAYAAIVPGTPVRWVADPSAPACAETAANVGAGPVRAGDQFPSGHVCPPTQGECRCLLVTAQH